MLLCFTSPGDRALCRGSWDPCQQHVRPHQPQALQPPERQRPHVVERSTATVAHGEGLWLQDGKCHVARLRRHQSHPDVLLPLRTQNDVPGAFGERDKLDVRRREGEDALSVLHGVSCDSLTFLCSQCLVRSREQCLRLFTGRSRIGRVTRSGLKTPPQWLKS